MKKILMTNVKRVIRIDPVYCTHERMILHTTGGTHYSEGELWDDIKEYEVCLDCGYSRLLDETTDAIPF